MSTNFRGQSIAGCSTVAVAALLCATPSNAQATRSEGTPASSTSSNAVAAESDTGLAEIVVTAQRRSESLQRTALAVSAVGGEQLTQAGITDAHQLTRLVPALIAQPSSGTATGFFLRGVGSLVGNAFTENPVAFNYGSVYVARPAAVFGTFYDLQRVEVLKGPQGTLYGRNATGGAINVIPNQPQLDATNANLTFEIGNYSSIRTQAAVNLPLGSSVALRIAGQVTNRDGYLSDSYDDESGQAIRGSLLFEPSGPFRALLVADYFHQGGRGPGSVLSRGGLTPNAPKATAWIGGSDPRSSAVLNADIPFLYASGLLATPKGDGFVNSEFWGVSADLSYDFGPATLTVIPAYRDSRPNYLSYSGSYAGRVEETSKQKSLEVRLASNGSSPLTYVVGAYIYDEKQNAFNDFNIGPILDTFFTARLDNKSYAIFGQATYAIFPGFRFVAGVRQTWDKKTQNTSFTNLSFGTGPTARISGKVDFSKFTWKAGVEYDAAAQNLLYANVSTGYKSGGFFIAALDNTFKPENITAYTVGSKNRFFSNRLQLNVEGFYWKYSDQQVNYLGPVRTSATTVGTALATTNAGNSRIYGSEIELLFRPTRATTLGVNLQYLNGKYTDYKIVQASGTGAPPRTTCAVTPSSAFALPPPGQAYLVDCSGKPQINSPKWSVNLSAEHIFELSDAFELTLGARSKIESSRYLSPEYLAEERQGRYTQTDAYLTLSRPADHVSLTAFVNNIENEAVYAGALLNPVSSVVYNILRAPRTFGLRLSASF